MVTELELRDEFVGEPCLNYESLIAGQALLLMHSNEIGATIGKVRVLSIDEQSPKQPSQVAAPQ